jgi:hypothetical protein
MMVKKLTKLRIDEISSVDRGAGEGCKIVLMKRDNSDDNPSYLFADIMKRRADDDEQRTNTIPDDDKLSPKLRAMVDALIVAGSFPDRRTATHYLLHNAHGRRVAEHLNNLSKGEPMLDINKLIPILEDGLMATVHKNDDETYAKAFTRKYENDIEFRRQWATLTDAKHLQSLNLQKRQGVPMATITPTSVGIDGMDDAAKAVKLLQEMAEKQHRTFEDVFADPNNKALAGRTYTGAHRPTASSTSGSELQR